MEEEIRQLKRELEMAKNDIEILQEDLDTVDERIEDALREGYQDGLENAISVIENLR